MACKLIAQTQDRFPLETAMRLSASLGYDPQAMAELLPEVAMGAALAMRETGNAEHACVENMTGKTTMMGDNHDGD